jgi:hypothetical protein
LNPNFRGDTREVEVEATCLDEEFRGEGILVLKVDVEGHEESVFAGGERLLSDGKVKHIVFEEHSYEGSEAVRMLKRNKYSIYSLEKTLRGPKLVEAQPQKKDFIATVDDASCRRKFVGEGWKALGSTRIR